MANLSTPGVGSGLDIRGIVDKLLSIERQPIAKIDNKLVELGAQVSAYGSLKSAMSSFRDAVGKLADEAKFQVYAARSSDTDVLGATASASAARGIYRIEVLRLAENHRLAANTTVADTSSTLLGSVGDTTTITVGTASFTVASGGKTLSQLRDAINGAADNKGVTASILKDDVGYRLVLSANDNGSAHALAVSYSGADPLALQTLNADRNGSGGFTPLDLDASVKMENNFTVTSSSNTLANSIEGVTLTLKEPGTTTVTVDRDTAAVQSSVQSLAKAYSDLVGLMGKMRNEILRSDRAVLANIESQMRAVLNSNSEVGGSFSNAFEVGISTNKDGTLAVNATTLSKSMLSDYEGFAQLFADPDKGLAARLRTLADGFLATGGALDGRSQGLDSQIRDQKSAKARLTQRLVIVEARLNAQFGALDSLVSSLQGTGSMLTQQLSGLENFNRQVSSG